MRRAFAGLWGLALLLVAAVALAQPAPSSSSAAEGPSEEASAEPRPDEAEPVAQGGASPAPSASAASAPRPPRVSPYEQTTPRQTVAGLLRAVDAGKLDEAARYLDLRGMRWGERTPGETAALIADVLKRRVWLDVSTVSDDPEGDSSDGADFERLATIEVDGNDVSVALVRVQRGGERVWLVSPTTVAKASELAEALGTRSWVLRFVPDHLEHERWAGLWAWQWIGLLIAVVAGFPLGWLLTSVVLRLFGRIARRTEFEWDDAVVSEIRNAARFVVGWAVMCAIGLSLRIPTQLAASARPWILMPLVLATGWLIIQAIRAATGVYLEKVPDDVELNTRGLRTQLVMLRKIGSVSVALVTVGVALMQFDIVRSVGWSLLASAGVAGVALGFAAQKSLGAVIAGLQLSVTQPIRLGDAIIVQNQWGEVEEITLTYVRIKLWDERRMVVPVDKFLTEIFENWSKPGDSLVGIVELAVDPTAPVPKLRTEFERLAAEHPHHDGRDCRLQLIDVNEQRMLLRCRISTDEISETFGMRCDIREAMMDYLQRLDGGRYLPRQRWERVERKADEVEETETEAT
jgi:small-conductance mechanosensitive channel